MSQDVADFWNQRFSAEDYIYGTAPNDFLAQHYRQIPAGGRVLSLGEGEGRNAVFLARQGYQVTAVDAAEQGLIKIRRLAAQHGVEVATIHADLEEFCIEPGQWDGIISIFCHLPASLRQRVNAHIVAGLRPGGVLLLEGYTPRQLQFATGGPKDTHLLLAPADLQQELSALSLLHLQELQREVIEGRLHTGLAAVVQVLARRESAHQ